MKLPENTQDIYFSELQPWFLASNQQPTLKNIFGSIFFVCAKYYR